MGQCGGLEGRGNVSAESCVIGSDAHVAERVGADFEGALDALEKAGYCETHYFIERQRRTVPIAESRASLK